MQQPDKVFNRGTLRYVTGDATRPTYGDHKLIIHIVNSVNAWGAGFVLALSKRWKKPEEQYHLWYRAGTMENIPFQLGQIQTVPVQTDISVVNMIAQEGIGPTTDKDGNVVHPLRLEALKSCLEKVAKQAKEFNSAVAAPRFGAGLASGKSSGYDEKVWKEIENLINECLINKGINVTIYDLPQKKD